MQRICFTLTFLFILALGLQAQPSVFGTGLVNGNPNYATYDLTDKGAFRQVRLQAGSSGTDRVWEFASGTAANTDYSINWRPYAGGQTLSSFNAVISPAAEEASARYNNNFGGASGLLPNVTAGNYYTVNVTENGPPNNNFMAILETTYPPATVAGVTGPPCATSCGYEVTVTLSNPPAAGEYAYVRYSTDGFATSGFIIVNFNGVSGMATIPIANANVAYYAYTSSNSLPQLISAVNTYGDVAHDMLALELGNNGGSNYNYSPCTTSNPVAVCQNTTVQLDGTGDASITSADIDGGSFDNCGLPSLSASPTAFTCSDVITATPTDLFFSEYAEGTGNNKYL
ncbi:MAG: hypothetical protein J5I98_12770, partial [Phaeodactylibacter sp.]|nr:hypothetical protein [Phaeodactylibacter sp.]